jgi:predicted transcriptional regulator of viral defense system
VKKNKWNSLIVALRKHSTISQGELEAIADRFVKVNIHYVAKRLLKAGVLYRGKGRGWYLVRSSKSNKPYIRNPFDLIQSVVGKDAVFCYASALEIHGLSRYGMATKYYVAASNGKRGRQLDEIRVAFVKLKTLDVAVATAKVGGKALRVTDLERTIIDGIHKPKYCFGWENVASALSKVQKVNARRINKYLMELSVSSLFAKVGYTLEHFRELWHVPIEIIEDLRLYAPRKPIRFFSNVSGRLDKRWNLYIPDQLFG